MKKQQTGIKETAFQLAREHGWELEYEGGLEIDGEYLDDADLTWTSSREGAPTYVLNISWSESTQFGYVITREESQMTEAAGSAFGMFSGSNLAGTPFENGAFGLPQQGNTVAEKYFIPAVEILLQEVEEAVKNLEAKKK